jgi:type I restriction enzyme M protein
LRCREEIRRNEYNLNIPRYVDSSEGEEKWDLYASMFGGIPMSEIDELCEYWSAFPGLQEALFTKGEGPYTELAVSNVEQTVDEHPVIKAFISNFKRVFGDFDSFLRSELITNMASLNISKEEDTLSADIFARLDSIPLISRYEAYQLLHDEWEKISVDLEIIQTEGFNAVKKVNPNMVIKKKDSKEEEVQEGWIGHIIPFELVQRTLVVDEYEALKQIEGCLAEISSEYAEILDSLSEEEKDSSVTNESSDAFVAKEVGERLKEIYADVDTQEIKALKSYSALSKKADKLAFISEHDEVVWSNMEPNKDGTYAKKAVNAYLAELQSAFVFPEDSFEAKIVRVNNLMTKEKEAKAKAKVDAAALHIKTKETIGSLSDEQAFELLEKKWIVPLTESIKQLPKLVIHVLVEKIKALSEKYSVTYSAVESKLQEAESTLSTYIDELTGNEYDMKGLSELQALLKGEGYGWEG